MATRFTLVFPALLGLAALAIVGVYQSTVLEKCPDNARSSKNQGNSQGSRNASRVPTDRTSAVRSRSRDDATEDRRIPLAKPSIGLGTLKIIVRGKKSGHALAGRQIKLSRLMLSDPVKTRGTDENGVVVFPSLPSGEWHVGAEKPFRTNRVEVLPNETTELELLMTDGMSVPGTVVDAYGQPVPYARVWLSTGPITYAGEVVTRCDRQGRFVLHNVPRYRVVSACADGYQFAMPVAFFWKRKPEVQVVLRHRGVPLQGVVVDTAGNPIAGARISIGHFAYTYGVPGAYAHDGSVQDDDLRPPLLILHTKSDGTFQTSSAPSGSVPIYIDAPGYGPKSMTVEPPLPSNRPLQITLSHAATIKGTVRAGDGSTPYGVAVCVVEKSSTPPWVCRETLTATDGTFTLRDVAPGKLRMSIFDNQWGLMRAWLTVAPGATTQWNPTLEEGRVLSGRLVDSRRTPQVGWRVVALFEGDREIRLGNIVRNMKTDHRGSFRFLFCMDGPYTLCLYPPGPKQPTELDLLSRWGNIPPDVAPPTNAYEGLWPGRGHMLMVSEPIPESPR